MNHRILLFIALAMAVAMGIAPAVMAAADKNGVSANTISLPSGPGSIEGLGEAFQPMLNTGTAKYAVGIALPACAAGHSPEISLNYESGHGDGPAGVGWTFGPGSVGRQTDKGIPRYVDGPNGRDDDHDGEIDEADEVDRFIGLEDEELVALADGTYRARIEGTFIRYRRVGNYWEAHLKDGTRLEFGVTAQASIADETGTRIFRWLLEKRTDTNGNVIAYSYSGFPGSDNQRYLTDIRYGPGPPPWAAFYFAHFTYEDRLDRRRDCRSGFPIRTDKRLARIDIGIQGVLPDKCLQGDWNLDGTTDALIRRYLVAYDPAQSRSFLSQVTQIGADGVSYLPPISFAYSIFNPAETMSAAGALISSTAAPTTVMDSPLVELIDLNRDSLPDILQTDLYGAGHRYYLNLGTTDRGQGPEIEWDEGRDMANPYGQALMLHLVEETVHLADMDGNGISDLIHTPTDQEVYYYLNQGDGSWSERRRMSIQDTAPPAPFANADVKTADLDFDKRMDVVQSTDNGYTIWFNIEDGKYSREVRTAGASYQGSVIRFSFTGVHLEDLNGDRMNDVARIRPTQVIYCASLGHGIFDSVVAIPIPDTVLTDGTGGQVDRAELKDINGDGLADLVLEGAQVNELWYWINLGNDTLSTKHIVTDMPTVYGPNTVTRWADINGNGTTDLIHADSSAASRIVALDIGVLAGGSTHPNLLTGIDNGLGVVTEITYKGSTEYYREAGEAGRPWSVTIPFPVSVVDRVCTTTGLDVDTISGTDEYIKTYQYRDGFYEDREKAFRGFAEVTVTEPGDATAPTRVSTHGFFTGGPDGADNDGDGQIDEVSPAWHREEDALKGKVQRVDVRAADGFLFSEENNYWQVDNLAVGTDGTEVRLACNREHRRLIYEGTTTPETLSTTFVYDDFGNVTEARNYGALGITGDEVFTFTEYINDTDLWILGLPRRQTTTDAAATVFSETLNYYDGPDYTGLPPGQVDRGNLTRREGWVAETAYVDLVNNAYDTHGNIVGLRNPTGHHRVIAYDTILHTYPVREDIEVGGGNPDLTTIAAYHPGLGVAVSATDFNGHQTTFGYDTFGRLTSIVRPGDSPVFPTLAFTYTIADPEKGLIYAYDDTGLLTLTSGPPMPSSIRTETREVSGQAGTFDTIQYVDGLGRKLALVEEGQTGFTVKAAVLFNALGGVRYAFLPYAAALADYAAPVPGLPAVETRYDAPGRAIIRINPPDADNVITGSTVDYLPLSRTETDENGNPRTFFHDGLDRLTAVHEHNLSETYATGYAYDPLGNLVQVTDARNNIKTFEYDGLSRKTAANDPDRGRTAYTYDDAGNLIQTVDNKGQTIVYSYDGANRLLTEDYLDGALVTPDVAFTYDITPPEAPAAGNTRGKLSAVADLSGSAFFSYDPRGNPVWSLRRIVHAGVAQDFVSTMDYDASGRMVSMTYPDGDEISYIYNNRSLLHAIPGVVDQMDYHPSGQLKSIAYANGLATTYAYDPRARLTELVTEAAVPDGNPLQDLTYRFDGVGNITAMLDNRVLSPASPENATQSFQYDDLSRLTRAEGPGYGAIAYQYDSIGNMTFKGSPALPDLQHIDDPLVNLGVITSGAAAGTGNRGVRLPGADPGPHAVTGTQSGLYYDYDDNGNMTDANGDGYAWDFMDRLVQTATADTLATYVYDHSGQRTIMQTESNGAIDTVYYVNPAFEIRDGRPVKYVFDGSRRLARIEGRLTGSGETSRQTLSFRPGWNFFSLEVEPDDPAITAVLAPMAGRYTQVWTFDAATQQYRSYIVGQGGNDFTDLHAQQGYIIHVTQPSAILIAGTRATQDIGLAAGWNLIPCPADSPMPVADALASVAGQYESVWIFDTAGDAWQKFMAGQPGFVSNLDGMEPGRAYWVRMETAAVLAFLQQPTRTHFYHPDHLGSSSVVTDDTGAVVERTEFYPYGRLRHELRANFESAYKFTGKERDSATGLDYFGARYYDPGIGSFLSTDPLSLDETDLQKKVLLHPQQLNIYSYVANNPVKYIDPDGLELVVPQGLKKEYAEARRYLISKSPHAARLLKKIEGSKQKILITRGKFESFYDPDKKEIEWDPNWGQKTKSGRVQSPALILAHEISHAIREMNDPQGYDRDLRKNLVGDPLEEKRVILGDETIIAKQLGEPSRREWDATPARVRSATSRITKEEFNILRGSLRGALQLYKQGEIGMKEYQQITQSIRTSNLE